MSPQESRELRAYFPSTPIPAAVLVPLVEREDDLTVLLTQRASQLKNHAGQISFPAAASSRTTPVPAKRHCARRTRRSAWIRSSCRSSAISPITPANRLSRDTRGGIRATGFELLLDPARWTTRLKSL